MDTPESLPRRVLRRNPLSTAERRNRYAAIAAALFLLLYAFILDPEKVGPLKCVFKEWTGLNCFACGLSHSLHASAAFDWVGALKYHIFGPVLFLSAWILSIYWIFELALDGRGFIQPCRRSIRALVAAAACLWVLYWLYNLGVGPR